MTRACLVVWAALALAGCGDVFSPPPSPDRSKEPYDFSVAIPPYTGPGADLAHSEPRDLAGNPPPTD